MKALRAVTAHAILTCKEEILERPLQYSSINSIVCRSLSFDARRVRPSFRVSCRNAVGWSGTQYVRSKRKPLATSPSIGATAFAWKSGWCFIDRLPGGEVVRPAQAMARNVSVSRAQSSQSVIDR
jgi:hypothetical protein